MRNCFPDARTLAVALVAILAVGAFACSDAATDPIAETEPTVTGEALAERLAAGATPLILDVRTPEEFQAGRVPGAINIPHTELAARLDELGPGARDREVVVYCESGRRAAVAEAVLRDAGYARTVHLEGDMAAWRRDQRPCENC